MLEKEIDFGVFVLHKSSWLKLQIRLRLAKKCFAFTMSFEQEKALGQFLFSKVSCCSPLLPNWSSIAKAPKIFNYSADVCTASPIFIDPAHKICSLNYQYWEYYYTILYYIFLYYYYYIIESLNITLFPVLSFRSAYSLNLLF